MPRATMMLGSVETLMVSRLLLDNVRSIQASRGTQGDRVGQPMLARHELVRLIRDSGYAPVQRDTLYREVRRF